jgi:hypothetical protein
MMIKVPPSVSALPSLAKPVRCANGVVTRKWSACEICHSTALMKQCWVTTLEWVMMAPFGFPVVPEVYMITASSASARSLGNGVASSSRRLTNAMASPPEVPTEIRTACGFSANTPCSAAPSFS